jgi:hypothetical protein
MKKIVTTTLFLFLLPMLLSGCNSPGSHLALLGQFYVAKDKAGYYVKINSDREECAVTKHMSLTEANLIANKLNSDVGPNWYYLENP